jgi:multiple antibiotic resistance protein
MVSYYLGVYLLHFFGITIPALRVAGGLIIFRSWRQLLNLQHTQELQNKIEDETNKKEDISFSPLAMPLLAGPGSMSFLITLFSTRSEVINEAFWQDVAAISAILVVVISIYFVFKFAPRLMKYTGQSGLTSLSKVMGFIVTGIGVQMIISSLTTVIKSVYLDLHNS